MSLKVELGRRHPNVHKLLVSQMEAHQPTAGRSQEKRRMHHLFIIAYIAQSLYLSPLPDYQRPIFRITSDML